MQDKYETRQDLVTFLPLLNQAQVNVDEDDPALHNLLRGFDPNSLDNNDVWEVLPPNNGFSESDVAKWTNTVMLSNRLLNLG